MTTLKIKHVGQIREASLAFGDLTVLVGPQATGKSIALQMFKLMVDARQVQVELSRYGLDWSRKLPDFLDVYLGEGMHGIWRDGQSSIEWGGKAVDMHQLAARKPKKAKDESIFFIPAQRVLALRDGWPRPFTDYAPGDPFAVREYSEKLRVLVEQEFVADGDLFPRERRLKQEFRDLLEKSVFSGFRLKVDKFRSQKRLVLGQKDAAENLPYMVWSAGQREFVPLLLGFYWLMPPTKVSTRAGVKWVVLEELEMGLHPRAIAVVVLLVLELVVRGYQVCLSTHSPQVLDALWALRCLRNANASPETLLNIFEAPNSPQMRKVAIAAMKKIVKVYYFNRESGTTTDISNLDPSADVQAEAGWGGLSEFSGRANEAVARAVANAEKKGQS